MAIHPLWSDDYWLLLMQLYIKKPAGVKSEYSRHLVELGIQLHIPPKTLHRQMQLLERHDTPSLRRLWDTYIDNPRKLNRDAKQIGMMAGFGEAGMFYDGVCSSDSLEHDYRPVAPGTRITPVMLTIILELYFTLTPNTMVKETPEVEDTARLLGLSADEVVEALRVFQTFDPILKCRQAAQSPIAHEAEKVWKRYCNEEPEQLQAETAKLKEYFL